MKKSIEKRIRESWKELTRASKWQTRSWNEQFPELIPTLEGISQQTDGEFSFQVLSYLNITTNIPLYAGEALLTLPSLTKGLQITTDSENTGLFTRALNDDGTVSITKHQRSVDDVAYVICARLSMTPNFDAQGYGKKRARVLEPR